MRWISCIAGLMLCSAVSVYGADEYQLGRSDKLPEGLAEKVSATLEPTGQVISLGDQVVCTFWFAKTPALRAKFKPTLTVKYPFTAGQLVGVLEVKSEEFSDFRGQPVKEGVYTLRYGLQPQDGNHVGTSETSDFLLAIPAASDTDPAPIKVPNLMKRSAKATGSNHPAIFSLLPPDDVPEAATLTHAEEKEFWIYQFHLSGQQGDETIKVPCQLVVIGKSEG